MDVTPIDQLAIALAAAQAEMPNAEFNRENPHFKSEYADLASIRKASLPSLSRHGLAITQYTRMEQGAMTLYTILMHKSGQFVYATYPITLGTPQNMGSQLTYARRYSWSGIIGMAADEDDDAEVAEASKDVPRETSGTKSAYRARKDKIYETLEGEIKAISTEHGLKVWGMANAERIGSMPENWRMHFREAYDRRMTELREGVTEEGKPTNGSTGLKKKLLESIEQEARKQEAEQEQEPEPGSAG